MAHTKALKAAKGNKDSIAKRLGVKYFGGQEVKSGYVIVRQRGTKVRPGSNTYMGKDYTIHAQTDGKVKFYIRKSKLYVAVE
ncbi:MAG: 50S ribosomal protein L27 [Patescibacteria group bacterium]|nr:MAG: 50S ribosomal protein L27 [Patescibacteria group bacterium]